LGPREAARGAEIIEHDRVVVVLAGLGLAFLTVRDGQGELIGLAGGGVDEREIVALEARLKWQHEAAGHGASFDDFARDIALKIAAESAEPFAGVLNGVFGDLRLDFRRIKRRVE
jgi:hypothetical protein